MSQPEVIRLPQVVHLLVRVKDANLACGHPRRTDRVHAWLGSARWADVTCPQCRASLAWSRARWRSVAPKKR